MTASKPLYEILGIGKAKIRVAAVGVRPQLPLRLVSVVGLKLN